MKLDNIQIELTNRCNAKCPMCSHRLSERKIVDMELSLLDKIVEDMVTLELPQFIGVCGIGEPMLHPQFKEAISMISHRLPYSIGTNAQELDKYIPILMDTRFTELVLSIDSTTKETHRKMRPSIDLETVEKNVLLLLKELRHHIEEKDVFWKTVYIQMVVGALNVHEVNQFIERWLPEVEGLDFVKIYIKPICPSPIASTNLQYPPPRFLVYSDYIRHPSVILDDFTKPRSFKSTCMLLDTSALILSDGAYTPCCMDGEGHLGVGNMKEHSMLECFNSEKLNYFRQCKERGVDIIPFCDTCI